MRARIKPYPRIRMLLESIPEKEGAAALGVSPKTFQRRRSNPDDLTIGEVRKLMVYESTRGRSPAELIREIFREDMKL